MTFDGILTAPPAYTPPSRRQEAIEDVVDRSASYSRLTQSYASIWDGCARSQLASQVDCFVGDVASWSVPQDYTTLKDPLLPLLVTVQSFLASQSTSASTSQSTSPSSTTTPGAKVQSAFSSATATATASSTAATDGAVTSQKPNSPSSSSSSNHTGAIIGGVITGLVLIVLAVLATLFYRRRARKGRAPSAEFMHIAHGGSDSPILAAKDLEGTTMSPPLSTAHGGDRVPLARQTSLERDDLPPAFSPGNFKDPVYEKVHASAAMREEYEARDLGGGYKD